MVFYIPLKLWVRILQLQQVWGFGFRIMLFIVASLKRRAEEPWHWLPFTAVRFWLHPTSQACQERSIPTLQAQGHHILPVTKLQLTRRSQGQRGSLLLWTTSTAWLCFTWPLPLVDQGCCSCPWWHGVGCNCCSHPVPKDGKITITHMYMHLHFEYLTRQLFMGKIFWSIYTLKHKIWFSS